MPDGWIAVDLRYAELHPKAVRKIGDFWYRPEIPTFEFEELRGKGFAVEDIYKQYLQKIVAKPPVRAETQFPIPAVTRALDGMPQLTDEGQRLLSVYFEEYGSINKALEALAQEQIPEGIAPAPMSQETQRILSAYTEEYGSTSKAIEQLNLEWEQERQRKEQDFRIAFPDITPEDVLGTLTSITKTEGMTPEQLAEADTAQAEFLQAIQQVGKTLETELLLSTVFPAARPEDIDALFGMVAPPEFKEEGWLKDNVIDPLIIGGVTFIHGLKTSVTSLVPALFAGLVEKKEGVISPLPEEWSAWKQNLLNDIVRSSQARFLKYSEEQETWLAQHPELTPKPEYEGNPFENPQLFRDPGYYAYAFTSSLAYSLSCMATIVTVTAATGGNPIAGIAAGMGVAGMPEASQMTKELLARGVPFNEAVEWGILYGGVAGGVESVTNLPLLGLIFKPIKQIVDPLWKNILKLTANRLARGAIAGVIVPNVEGMEEAITQATHNAIVRNYNPSQKILEGVSESWVRGTLAALPFGALGGMASFNAFRGALPAVTQTNLDELINKFKTTGATEEQAQVMAVNEIAKTPEGEGFIQEAIKAVKEAPKVEAVPEVIPEVIPQPTAKEVALPTTEPQGIVPAPPEVTPLRGIPTTSTEIKVSQPITEVEWSKFSGLEKQEAARVRGIAPSAFRTETGRLMTWAEMPSDLKADLGRNIPIPQAPVAPEVTEPPINRPAMLRLNTLSDKKNLTVTMLRDPQKGLAAEISGDPFGAYDFAIFQSKQEWSGKDFYLRSNWRKIAEFIDKEWGVTRQRAALPKAPGMPEAVDWQRLAETRAKEKGISIAQASREIAEERLAKPEVPTAPPTAEEVAPSVEPQVVEEIPLSESLQSAYDEIRMLREQKATTEKVKDALVRMIKKHLPLPRQGEWLAKVKNVKTEADLAEAIIRVREVAEAHIEKILRADIIQELKKTAPRIEKGITVGRLTPEVQPIIEKLRVSLLVGVGKEGQGITANVEAYEAARAKIEQNIVDYREGKITWDALLESNEELKYTGMYGMSSVQLQEALDYIQELKRLGKDLRKIKRDTIRAQRQEVVDKAVVEVTGGEGIKPGIGTLRGKDLAGIKKVLDQPVNSQYGLVNLLDKLGKFAKGTKQYKGFLMRFANLTQRAVNTENAEREATFKQVRDKFREIYNVPKTREATRLLTTLTTEDVDLGTFKITTKEGVTYLPIKLTRAEMMEAYQLYKNPKNLETFKEGMHWTPEIMTKIVNTLTEHDIAWADWLQNEFYNTYYDKILPFYQQEFNIDMPKNPDYVPQSRDFDAGETDEVQMLLNDQKRYASVTNKSLKARQENIRPFQLKGVFTVLTNHIIQMEHFMAWAETMHELRSTFGNNEVRTAVKQYHSNDILERIDSYMNDFARGGVDRVQFLNILDRLRSNFAVSVLAIKPSIGIQQIWTVGAFMTEMKAWDFVTGMADFYSHPIENYKWMMENSTYIKNRYSGGNYERDIRLAQQQGVAKTMSGQGNIVQYLLWQVTQGDKVGVMPGWWAKYKVGLKEGLSQADAMIAADLASERTQNTSELASLSWLQRGNSWGKLLTMFQSQPNKYFRIIADNIRNMQYGRQSKVKGITNILIVWVLLPMLFQWVADAFKWKKERQARILLLGPLNNILVAGQLIQTAWGWFTDDNFDWQVSPVLSTVRDFQNFSSKLMKIIGQVKDPYEDVVMDDIVAAIEFFSKGMGQLFGAPTPYLIMVERAIRSGDLRQLVFSRWALEEPKADLQGKTAKIVNQLGQVVEDVTDLPVDKKPPVYDTGKAFSEVKQALSKTLLSDVTEKNGFSPQVVAIVQAIMAQDTLETLPNKRLFEIIDDIMSDNTLNYTFSQYYMDYQDRQKIDSLAKLKDWDAEHPRFNLGNVTPTQFALMRQYEALETKAEKVQFRKDHPEINVNPRQEWLKSHSKENAQLAIWEQAKLLTKEAYDEAQRLIKELDIPNSAVEGFLPPDGIRKPYFERLEIVDKWGANSWEDKLLRAQNPELNKWLELGESDTPTASLELKANPKFREIYDKIKTFSDKDSPDYLDDKVKDKNGLTARDRAIAGLKATKIGDLTYRDIERKIDAIEKGTNEIPTPEPLVQNHIDFMRMQDAPGVGSSSAEAMLFRVDNPDYDRWRTDTAIWGDQAFKPVDQSKIPGWRLEVKYRKEDAAYNALPTTGTARTDYLTANTEYRKDRRRREAYQKGLLSDNVQRYVDYYELPEAGYKRERFLFNNPDFAKTLGLKVPIKVPSEQYDILLEKGAKTPEDELRLAAYLKYIPDARIEDYVGYHTIIARGKPEGQGLWFEDDWFLLEHKEFYATMVAMGLWQPKDFSKIPSREVFRLYQTYLKLVGSDERLAFRRDHPDLDACGVLTQGWKPATGRVRGKIQSWRETLAGELADLERRIAEMKRSLPK